MIDYIQVGKRIKNIRLSKELTQEKLAELTGLSNNYISNIECAKSIPSIDVLVRICNALGTTTDHILLDSVYAAKEIIADDIAAKLKKCSNENLKLISDIISLILEKQEKKDI